MATARGGLNQMCSSARAVAPGLTTLPACQRNRCQPCKARSTTPDLPVRRGALPARAGKGAAAGDEETGEGEETACVTTCTSNGFWIARHHRHRPRRRLSVLLLRPTSRAFFGTKKARRERCCLPAG
ncbi:hypothetical protein CNECB9_1640002 [Cupriavidus necator]|uniref:Uncharacterized protein n=1 Tax=Cupriavidus necator TaxID=106590 RepID=A0A1K0J8D1_CUPNE|nr:hypothetical protein CNECB9_1640002 [Cupriavidus necator]